MFTFIKNSFSFWVKRRGDETIFNIIYSLYFVSGCVRKENYHSKNKKIIHIKKIILKIC